MSVPNWRMRAEDRVLVLGDEAEPLVVGVEERELAALGVDRRSRSARRRRRAGAIHVSAVRSLKRGSSSASSSARCSARAARVGEARVVDELGHAERAGTAPRHCSSVDRGDLDPAVAASRTGGSTRRVPVWSLSSCGHGHAPRRRRAARRTRTSRRRRAATSTAPGPRRSCAGGTARRGSRRPRASRWRCRTCRSGSRSAGCPRAPGPDSYSSPADAWYSGSSPPKCASGPSRPYAHVLQ